MKTESLHRGWGRFAVVASVLACFLSASSSAFAADFLAGAVSSFPTGWSVSGEAQPGDVATQSGSGDTLTLAFDLADDQTLTYTAPTASDANGTADVVISNAVFTTAYEYPGVEAVGGIDSQAAICVYTNTTSGGALQYYGWAGAYTVENDVTKLTWFALSGATPVEGATNTVTMSFDYTASPATVTFKVGNTTLTPNPVQLVNNTRTQVTGVSFSGTGSIGEMASQSAPPAPSTFTVNFYASEDAASPLWTTNDVPAGATLAVYGGTAPTKASTDQYVYTFDGWTNATVTTATAFENLPAVVSDTNYWAHFAVATKIAPPTGQSLTYNGSQQAGVASGTGYTLTGETGTNAGNSYSATATLAAGYIWSDGTTAPQSIAWSIAPKSVGLTWGETSLAYTGSAQAPTATLVATDIVNNDDVTVSVSGAETNVGGPYTATATLGGTAAANYVLSSATTTFSIGKVALVFSVSMDDWTFGGTAADPSVTFTTGSGTPTYTYSADGSTWSSEKPTAAGEYTVKATVAASENYNAGEATDDFTIAKAEISVPSGVNATYDGTPKTGLAEGEGYTRGGDYTATAAGNYTATATPDANHTWVGGGTAAENVSWSIAKATVSVTADAKTQVYGADPQPLTYTAGTLATGNSFTGALAREAGDNVGTYSITIGTLTAGDNYTISFTGANYVITGAPITPVVSLDGWTVGDTPNSPSLDGNTGNGTVTYFYSADNGSTWTETQPTAAGTYLVKASVAASGNYAAGESDPVSFTIAEAVTPTLALAKPTLSSTVLANAQSGAVVRATIDPTATVNATNATADVVVDGTNATATFTSLPWNDPVDWMLQSAGAADLPGRFYAKGETPWFNVATDSLDTVSDLAEGMKGVDMSDDPSAAGQMVRIQTALEIAEGAMESLPTGNDVGEARTGFAVASLADDEGTAYFYAFNGSTWDKLVGAEPTPGTKDLLIVLDVEAATARYYVDGIALYKEIAGVRTPAIPMKAFENGETKQINGIGFANPDGVATNVVAEYDVPFEAAVGDVPYAAAADGLANADKTGAQTLYLLTNDVAGTIELNVGDIVKVDTTKGSFAQGSGVGLVSGIAAGYTLGVAADGNLTTYTVDLVEYPIEYVLGLAGATNAVANPTSYNVSSNFPIALLPAGCPDYTFNGWTNAAGAVVTEIAAGTTGAVTNWATWRRNAFTITWNNYDGALLGTTEVLPGDPVVWSGADPEKAADNTYTYTFVGWSDTQGGSAIMLPAAANADATYFAVFDPVYIDYTVTWTDHDGTVKTESLHYGDTPTAPSTAPAQYVEDGKIYTGTWPTPADVTGNATYAAVYDEGVTAVATVFTVADNGATTNTVGTYSTLADAFGAATNGCTLALLASATADTAVTVTNGVTVEAGAFTATFSGGVTVPMSATATFVVGEGGSFVFDSTATLVKSYYAEDPATTLVLPTSGYSLTANGSIVTDSPENTYVKKVVADGTDTYSVIRKRSVVTVAATGATVTGVGEGQRVAPGETLEIGAEGVAAGYEAVLTITKHADASVLATTKDLPFSYEMPDFDVDVSVEAVLKTFTVIWVVEDQVPVTNTVAWGTATADVKPADPTKASTGSAVYAFAGWSPALAETVTQDATYTAQFSSIYLDPASLAINYNCYGTVAVSNAPAGATFFWTMYTNDVAFTSLSGPLPISSGKTTATLKFYAATTPVADGWAVVSITNGAEVITLRAPVVVKDVAAVVDGVEYAKADLDAAGAAALAGGKTLGLYVNGPTITLAEGQTLVSQVLSERNNPTPSVKAPAGTAEKVYTVNTAIDNATKTRTYTLTYDTPTVMYTSTDGQTVEYLDAKFKMSKDGTYKLLKDVERAQLTVGNVAAVLDLDGHEFSSTVTGSKGAIYVDSLIGNASLTIRDTAGGGSIVAENCYAIWGNRNAAIAIEGGEIVGKADVVYLSNAADTLTITGGTFRMASGSANFMLNMLDSARGTITVTGGSFQGFDPANNVAEGAGTSFLPATGYVSVADDPSSGWYTVYEAVTVTFVDEKADPTTTAQVIGKGKTADKPADPAAVAGFRFDGWFAEGAEEAFDFDTAIDADLTLTAKWTPTTATVIWVVEGTQTEETYDIGATPAWKGATPTKTGSDSSVYVFTGWSPALAEVTAEGATYTAQFSSIYLDPASLAINYNCYGTVAVSNAPAGATFFWTMYTNDVAFTSLSGPLPISSGKTTATLKFYAATTPVADGWAVVSITNGAEVITLRAPVVVKDVAAVVDGVEYAKADLDAAGAAALAGGKTLGLYVNGPTITLAEGQTLVSQVLSERNNPTPSVKAPAGTAEKVYTVNTAIDNATKTRTYTLTYDTPTVMYTSTDGQTVEYLDAKFKMSKDGTYKLLKDVERAQLTVGNVAAVLDLDGHEFSSTVTGSKGAIYVDSLIGNASLTIRDTAGGGSIVAENCYAIWGNRNAAIAIEGGEIVGKADVVYLSNAADTLTITGGTFRMASGSANFMLNMLDSARGTITVTGGSFQGFDPANNVAEGAGTSFLPATGYVSVADDPSSGWFTVYEAVTVTFADDNVTPPEAQVIGKGKTATEPTAPAFTGWTFEGWYTNLVAGEAWDFDDPVVEDITLTAKWTQNEYDVIWVADGAQFASNRVAHGTAMPVPATNPTKDGDDALYTFVKWTPAQDATVTSNATYTAEFKTWTKVAVPAAVAGLVYNENLQTGVVENVGYTLTGNTGTNAGDYTATATLADAANTVWADDTAAPSANSSREIAWSIDPASISLTVSGYTAAYDGAAHGPTFTVEPADATITWSVDGGAFAADVPTIKDFGSKTVVAKATKANYAEATSESVTIAVSRASATVTADTKSKSNGDPDPALTATVDGLVEGDSLVYTVTRASGEEPGTYTITPAGDPIQGNYEVEFVTGTFTIGTNPQTVIWVVDGTRSSQTFEYGDTPTYEGSTEKSDATGKYRYEFTGWNDGSTQYGPTATLPPVTGEITYTATYDQTIATKLALSLADHAVDATVNGLAATVSIAPTGTIAGVSYTAVPAAAWSDATTSFAFEGLDWNARTNWTVDAAQGEDPLDETAHNEGVFYAKASTTLFTAKADEFVEFSDMGTAGVGYSNEVASAAGEAVRVHTTIDVPEGGLTDEPDVGDAKAGFAVLQLTGDAKPAFYAYNGTTWTKLFGVEPEAGEADYLAVYDFAAANPTVRYYIDGVALCDANGLYALPLVDMTTLTTIAFGDAAMVKKNVVAEQDVSYVAAIGTTGYTNATDAVAALDRNGGNVLTVLGDLSGATNELVNGQSVKIAEFTQGSGREMPTLTCPAGFRFDRTEEEGVWTFTVVPDTATVIWFAEGGSKIYETNIVIGTVPVYVREATYTNKAATAEALFTFSGWTDAEGVLYAGALPAVAIGGTNYTATFKTWTKVARPTVATGLEYTGEEQTGVTVVAGSTATGVTAATAAGSYSATVLLDSADSVWADATDPAAAAARETVTADWSIAPKTIALTWGETSFVWDGTAKLPTVETSDFVASDDVTVAASGGQTAVGTGYTATAALSGADAANYALPADPTTTFEIIAANAMTISVADTDTSATTTNYFATVQAAVDAAADAVPAVESVVLLADATETVVVSNAVALVLDGKTLTGDVTNTVAATISGGTVTGDLVADGAALSIAGGTYQGVLSTNGVGSISITGGHFVNDPTAFVADGYYADGDATNGYDVLAQNSILETTITVATNLEYDGTGKAGVTGVSFGGTDLVPDTDYTVEYTANTNAGVNTASAKITGIGAWKDYTIVTFSIAQKPLTVTAASDSKEYDGDPLTKDDYTATALAAGDAFQTVTVEGTITNVGAESNKVTAVSITNALGTVVTANYDITTVDGELEVTPAAMTITVADYSGEYDGQPHALVATPSVAEGTTVEYKVGEGEWTSAAPSVKDVADSAAVQVRATNANYVTATTNVTMTVTAKSATITADNKTKVYDNDASTDPELTATVTGAIEGETIAYELSREAGQTVANYAITVTVGENPNYTVTPEGAIFSITAATVQIPAAPGNKEYNGAAQTAGATATDTYTVVDEGGVNVADYTVTYALKDTANYTWSDGSITNQVFGWSITPAAATVKADDASKKHGEADPASFTATVSGLQGSDTEAVLTYTVTRAEGEAIGTYTITPAGDTAQGNYTVTYQTGTFTIISNAFTVIWLADNGDEIDTTEVEWGETPTHADATKASDGKYAYEFAAWTPTPGPVTEATNYVASFTQSIATPLALPLANHAVDATVNGSTASVALSPVGAIDGIAFSASPATATLDDATGSLSFSGLDWNEAVAWSVSAAQGEAELAETTSNSGKFYVKPETQWFTATTNQLVAVADASDAAVAYTNAVASNEGEMVRIHTKVAVPAVGLSAAPAHGSAKVGFAVLQLDGDAESAYYAFGNGTWTKLSGAKPTEGDHDYLAVYDLAAETPTARYYIDGVALYAAGEGGAKVYAFPLASGTTSLKSISFASKEMVKDDIVAKQDVSYVAAVGQAAYTNIVDALTAAGTAGEKTLELLKTGVALDPAVTLGSGEKLVVDYAKGTFTNETPVVSGVPGWAVNAEFVEGAVTNYSLAAIVYPIEYVLGGGVNDASNTNEYTVADLPLALASASRTGYTFAGWTNNVSVDAVVTSIPVGTIGAVTNVATWTINSYPLTINYLYTNGTVAATQFTSNVVYDTAYSVDSPVIDGYTADKLVVSGTMGAEPVTVDVTYRVNRYPVTFVDEDGTTLKAATEYDYGTLAADIAKPDDPTKAATADWVFTFAGWTPALADVTAEATYTATYTSNATVAAVITVADNGDGTATTNTAYIASLADAIAAANDGDTVQLLADVEEPAVALEDDITLDLNGNTWTVAGTGEPSVTNAVTIAGNVEIVDNSENGNGTISSAADQVLVVDAADEEGATASVTIGENAAIVATGDDATALAVVDGEATVEGNVAGVVEVAADGALTVDGGTVTGDVAATGGDVTVADGTVDGTITAAGDTATVAVSGGKVDSVAVSDGAAVTVSDAGSVTDGVTADDATVTVTGGTVAGGVTAEGDSTVAVSGGSVTGGVTAADDADVTVSGNGSVAGGITSATGDVAVSGGSVTGDIASTGGEVAVSGGTVTGGVDATGGTVAVSGGSVTDGVDVSNGADVTVSGGSVAGGVSAEDAGSTATITGGEIADGVTVADGATGSISGNDTVVNGTLTGTEETLVVTGGHFSEDPSDYVDTDTHQVTGNATDGYDVTERKSLEGAVITVAENLIYTGLPQSNIVAVVVEGETLTAGTDYAVTYANNVNAGVDAAIATIDGVGAWNGQIVTSFSIGKATLTATADDKTVPYGTSTGALELTVTVTGFVNNETTNDLVSVPVAACATYTATTTEACEITVSGGEAANYVFSYVVGTLTVELTPPAVNPGQNLGEDDYANGDLPIEVTAANFVVKFRTYTPGVTYQLVASEDLTISDEQWRGVAASGNAVPVGSPSVSTEDAATAVGEIITLSAPMGDGTPSTRFFKIRASVGTSSGNGGN